MLVNEWKILNEDVGAVDIPVPDRIWRNLPRRIDQKIVTVITFSLFIILWGMRIKLVGVFISIYTCYVTLFLIDLFSFFMLGFLSVFCI